MSEKIYRILDANINRAKEGLRVVEDFLRFYENNEIILKKSREIRHKISSIFETAYPTFLSSRNVKIDPGKNIEENKRINITKLVIANIKRVEEALRVLEEFSKLLPKKDIHHNIKNLRYSSYELEKSLIPLLYKNTGEIS
jgi:thiamine-phosphate pyrophosphorylase